MRFTPKVTILEKTASANGDSLYVRIRYEDGEEAGFCIGTPATEDEFIRILKMQVADHERSKRARTEGALLKESQIKENYSW